MPRKPRFIHPLRKVRRATSASTQAKFGALVGASGPTIQAIENGKLSLSDRLARRIERATGADRRELQRGARGRAVTVTGEPYQKEFFDAWQSQVDRSRETAESEVDTVAEQLNFWTRTLVRASREKEGKTAQETDRLGAARFALAEALQRVCDELNLSARVERVLRPLRKIAYRSGRYDQWRPSDSETPPLLEQMGQCGTFREDARITLAIDWVPRWSPDGRIPENALSSES